MRFKLFSIFFIISFEVSLSQTLRCPECGECDQSFFLPEKICDANETTIKPLFEGGDVKRAGISESAHPYGHNLACTHTIEVYCAPMKLTILKFDIEDEDPNDNYVKGDDRNHCEWDSIRLKWHSKADQSDNATCSPAFCGVVSRMEDYIWGQGSATTSISDFKEYGDNDPHDFGWMDPVYLDTTKVEIALHSDRSRSMYGFKIQYESGKECEAFNATNESYIQNSPCNTTQDHVNMICDESGIWKCDTKNYYSVGDECKKLEWHEWESWEDCSVKNSALGVQIRKRSCIVGEPRLDSDNCRKCNSSEPYSTLVDKPSVCHLDFRSCKAETGSNLEDNPVIGVISSLRESITSKRTVSDSEQEGLGDITEITINYCDKKFVTHVIISRGSNPPVSIPPDSTRTRQLCEHFHHSTSHHRHSPSASRYLLDKDIFSNYTIKLGDRDEITGVRIGSYLIRDRFSITINIALEIQGRSGDKLITRVEPAQRPSENTRFVTELSLIGRSAPKPRLAYTRIPDDTDKWQLGYFSASATGYMLDSFHVNWVRSEHWTEWGGCFDSLEKPVICNGTDSTRKRHKIVDHRRQTTTSCSNICSANDDNCNEPCMECNRALCPVNGTLQLASPKDESNKNLGILIIYRNGEFGTVCDDEWNDKSAELACEKLGRGPLKSWRSFSKSSLAQTESIFTTEDGKEHETHSLKILVDNINCAENATSWDNCTWIDAHNCGHGEDIVLECEARIDGWQRWSDCDQDCGGGTRKRIFKCYDCNEQSCRSCQKTLAGLREQNATEKNETCNPQACPEIGSIQLVNVKPDGTVETNPNLDKGIVRVFYRNENETSGGEWGTVCDDKFNADVGRVICRQLGFSSWKSNVGKERGAPKLSGKIWMDDMICNGYESRLDECYKGQRVGGRGNNCDHEEDLYIECGEKQKADWSPKQSITRNGWTMAKASFTSTHNEYRLYDGYRGNHFESNSSGTCQGNDVARIKSNSTFGRQVCQSGDECVWAYLDFNSSYTFDPTTSIRLWFSSPPRADVSVNVFVEDSSSENREMKSKLCKKISFNDVQGKNSSSYDVACEGLTEKVYAVNVTSSQQLCMYEIEAFAKEGTVKPNWTPWTNWSSCLPNCNNKMGIRTRHRDCQNRWAFSGPCADQKQKDTTPCHHVDCLDEWSVKLTWFGKKRAEHGMVQVKHNGLWGTICNDSVNKTRVCELVCNKLGWQDCLAPDMGSSSQEQPNSDKPNKGIWLDDMDCDNRTRLDDCTHLPWGSHNCGSTENLVVKCGNRIAVPGDVLLGQKQIRNDYKNKTAYLQWNTTTSVPICGIDNALDLVRGACHTETFFNGNVRLIDAPKNNAGGVLIYNCPEGSIFNCFRRTRDFNFKLIDKCTNYYEITCAKVDRKTIATQSLIETAPGPNQRALYVLSNTASRTTSAANCKTLNMTLAMPKTAADNILITQALEKSHFGYNYWLGMHYNTLGNGWFWDDKTPVEGPHAFTNFMPGQTRGKNPLYTKSCATLLTNLTDSSGFGDLGKWRMEQCSQDGINGLCSSSPGTDLALLYKCVDCLKTDQASARIFYYQQIESYRSAYFSPPVAGISVAGVLIALTLISSGLYFAYSRGLIESSRLGGLSCINSEEDNQALIADENDDDGTYVSPIISLPDPKKKDKDVNKSTYQAFDSKIGYAPMDDEDDAN